MADFVLIHGGWAGGWQWDDTARYLENLGNRVCTPTLTGLGELHHLAEPTTNLSVHLGDIQKVLLHEELKNVVLVGFSYGGMIATGVADREPHKVSYLLYLDAFVPQPGQSLFDILGNRITKGLTSIADSFSDGWKIPYFDTYDHRLTDQPIETAKEKLHFSSETIDSIKKCYIECTEKPEDWTFTAVLRETAISYKQRGGICIPFASDHFPMHSKPKELAFLLHEIVHST
jgi:pimeloyl-ACP methyl ester carboxylesterase